MKQRCVVFLCLLGVLFAAGCNDKESVTNVNEQRNVNGRVIGTIHGVVVDAANNARLPRVAVTTSINGQVIATTTNESGYYALSGLVPGDYMLTFTFPKTPAKTVAAAYAVAMKMETVPDLATIGIVDQPTSTDFPYSITSDMTLYPLTAGVTGVVFKRVDPETTTPAAGVTVVADYAGFGISEDEYSAVTGADGRYAFTNLPATPSVTIRTLPFRDGDYDFDRGMTGVMLEPGASVFANNVTVFPIGSGPLITGDNFSNGQFGLNETLTLTFSEAMIQQSFVATLTGPTGNVPAEVTWVDATHLTVNPYVALLPSSMYSLTLSGFSVRQVPFNDVITFSTVDGIKFLYTNVENADGLFTDFPVNQAIEVTYSKAVNLGILGTTINLAARDLVPSPALAITTTLANNGVTVRVTPVHHLEPGTRYKIDLSVFAADAPGDNIISSFTFRTAYSATAPTQVTGFALNELSTWKADWNTTAIHFTWKTQAGASRYYIYARDDVAKSDFVRVADVLADEVATDQSTLVNLAVPPFNTIFDYFDNDGIQTPFTSGRHVIFQISAKNDAGEGALSATVVTVGDDTAPTGWLGSQSSGANNAAGPNPKTITVAFLASASPTPEYLDATVTPTWQMVEAGGDAAYVLPQSAITFQWNANHTGGTFTLVIPANKNGAGDQLLVLGFKDTSGNTVATAVALPLL